MKTQICRLSIWLCCAALATGCASTKQKSCAPSSGYGDRVITGYNPDGAPMYSRGGSQPAAAPARGREAQPDRMLVWRARFSIDVWNVSNALAQAEVIAEQNGGYVEYKSADRDGYASLKLRIPVQSFTNAVNSVETLGEVTSRHLENEDVTEQYIDTEARLKNRIVLRDRLRQLLDKATEVKDILAIETELNRVQGDIDSMEALIKSLKGQVDFATVDLSLNRKEILGPLGYVFKGLWWTVSKLFVLRE